MRKEYSGLRAREGRESVAGKLQKKKLNRRETERKKKCLRTYESRTTEVILEYGTRKIPTRRKL